MIVSDVILPSMKADYAGIEMFVKRLMVLIPLLYLSEVQTRNITLHEAVKKAYLPKYPDPLNEDKDTALEEDVSILNALLEADSEPDSRDSSNATPLHVVSSAGLLKCALILLEYGADVEAADRWGRTPLHRAVIGQRSTLVRYLVKRRANVNARDNIGMTPLHIASCTGNTVTLRTLLDDGSDSMQTDHQGRSALAVSAECGKLEAFIILSRYPHQEDFRDSKGNSLLHFVVMSKSFSLLSYVLDNWSLDIDTQNRELQTPLHIAIQLQLNDVVRLLVYRRAALNIPDIWGNTPLHTATHSGNMMISYYLLHHGADPYIKNQRCEYPFQLIKDKNESEAFAYALKYPMDLLANPMNYTERQSAPNLMNKFILADNTTSIIDLLEDGFPIEGRYIGESTPLQFAMENCRMSAAKTLIERGANVNIIYNCSYSLLHAAVNRTIGNNRTTVQTLLPQISDRCSTEALEILLSSNADVNKTDCNGNTPLHVAAYSNNTEATGLLLEHGAALEVRNKLTRTPLFVAVMQGSTGVLRLLIENKADVMAKEFKPFRHWLPLHLAAKHGRLPEIELLVAAGANVEAKSLWYQRRPIHQAAYFGQAEAVKLLITKGADYNCSDSWDRSSLHLAAEKGHLGVVKVLVEAGADVNSEMREHKTPLVIAAENANTDIAIYLMKNGAKIKTKTEDRRTVLHLAAMGGSKELIGMLLDLDPEGVNTPDFVGKTPLYWAAFCGCVDAFKTLLEAGADPHARTLKNLTILHGAVEGGDVHTTEEALKHTVDINAVDDEGKSALFAAAATFGRRNIFMLLLKNGADPNIKTELNETLLHAAVQSGDVEITKDVLNMTSDMNARDREGITPLYRAAMNGRSEVFQLLLDKGADPEVPNNDGDTVLHWGAHTGSLNITEKLLARVKSTERRDSRGRTPLYIAAEDGKLGVFLLLIKKGAHHNISLDDKKNLLHGAVTGRNIEIARYVLNLPINVNAQDDVGRTPLFIAASTLSRQMVELLLKNGADTSIKTYDGQSFLHASAIGGDSNIIKTALLFVMSFNDRDHNGKTAIFYAAENSKTEAFKELVKKGVNAGVANGGWTILHSAAMGGDLEIVRSAMKLTNDINVRDDQGRTALFISVENYKKSAFRLLMDQGADPDISDKYGHTILHWASRYGEYFFAMKVLKKSLKTLNIQDSSDRTPLHSAVYFNRINIVRLLIKNRADPNKENMYGYTPLMITAAKGSSLMMDLFDGYEYSGQALLGVALAWNNREVMDYLLHYKVKSTEKTKVHIAAAKGDNVELAILLQAQQQPKSYKFFEIMKEISKEYVKFTITMDDDDVYIINPLNFRQTPLDMAVFFNGSIETLKIILNYTKATVKDLTKDRRRWTPLDMAAFCGKEDMVRFFLDFGIPPDYIGDDLWTPMHKAAWGGHRHLVRLLSENNDNINRRDALGRTPLHVAAMRGYNDTVYELIQLSKASLNKLDRYNYSPLHLAEIYGHSRFYEELGLSTITMDARNRYQMKDEGLSTSYYRNHTRTIELLLQNNVDPNIKDRVFGWTVLHWTAAIGHVEVADVLVKNGAKVNIPSRLDQTPMFLARFWGRVDVYNFLKKNGAVW